MNYFVSIGDCYEHEWQLKLLYNSFKSFNLEKNLYIALSTNTDKKIDFDNCFYFKNEGLKKEYLKYNKWYSLFNLIKDNILKLPVLILDPHTILIKPIDFNINSNIIVNNKTKESFYKKFILDNSLADKDWTYISDTIIINDLDYNFFFDILKNIEQYSLYLDDYTNLDKTSISYCLLERYKNIGVIEKKLESNLYQNDLNYILNYRSGFNNTFNKNFYNNKDFRFCEKDIKNNIANIRYTKCLDFFYNNITI